MKLKTVLAALVLAAAPSFAIAECNWGHANQQAMSCAEGMVFDPETQTCVEQVTS